MKILILCMIFTEPFSGRVGQYAPKDFQIVKDANEAAMVAYSRLHPSFGFRTADEGTWSAELYEINLSSPGSVGTVPIPDISFVVHPN